MMRSCCLWVFPWRPISRQRILRRGCSRAFLASPPTFPMAIPGQSFPVKVHVAESGPLPIKIDSIELKTPGATGWGLQARGNSSGQLDGGKTFDSVFDVHIPDNAGYTRPYFELPSIEQPYYDLRDPQYREMPLAPYPLEAWVTASYHGVQIHLE